MTSDQAKELFSDAYDGQLEAEARAAFDAALGADPELRADYARFRAALDVARGALGAGLEGTATPPHVPNLLPGIQHRLRVRSRGRYYPDRFTQSRRRGRLSPVYLLITLAVALVSLWIALHFLESVQPTPYPM